MHFEEIFKIAKQAFGELSCVPVLAQMRYDLALVGHVPFTVEDMPLDHLQLRFVAHREETRAEPCCSWTAARAC